MKLKSFITLQYNITCMNVLFNLWFYTSNSFSLSMTMLIKMQRTLVVFSLTLITLMLNVRVLFIFLRSCFLKILFQYTLKNSIGITWCVLKIVLVFTNIRPCKPPLNLLFFIAGLRSSGCYLFFFLIFFSSLFMGSWYIMCSKLLFFKL